MTHHIKTKAHFTVRFLHKLHLVFGVKRAIPYCRFKVALRPHSAQKIVTYFPAYFDELRYILPHCSIYSYYNGYLDS